MLSDFSSHCLTDFLVLPLQTLVLLMHRYLMHLYFYQNQVEAVRVRKHCTHLVIWKPER